VWSYSMNIYQPYTYLIGWTEQDKWYYGVRHANKKPPEDDLWKEYFTSSKYVKDFRHQFGEPDVVKIDKTFDSKEDAVNYEFDFLKENRAHAEPKWLNQSCFPSICVNTLTEEHKNKIRKTMREKYSGENNPSKRPEVKEKMSKALKGRTSTFLGKTHSDETKRQISKTSKGVPKPKLICPYCNMVGGAPQMKRYHFENCKIK
jgi:ribosomal protein S24E